MGTKQDVYAAGKHEPSDASRDAKHAALLRPKDEKEEKKPARPPVEEPNQAPAIEDPLPEESRDASVSAPRH